MAKVQHRAIGIPGAEVGPVLDGVRRALSDDVSGSGPATTSGGRG